MKILKRLRQLIPKEWLHRYYHWPKAVLANIYYGFPGKKIKVIGITGTDGKTTTANLIYHSLKAAGKKVSMVSTIKAVVAGRSYDTGLHVTTPGPFTLQKYLRQAVDHGDEMMVMEITAHALSQFRSFGIKYEVGVITNITPEHLDYYHSFENYARTKLQLLDDCRFAVINRDDPKLFQVSRQRVPKNRMVTFGFKPAKETGFKASVSDRDLPAQLPLPGEYNRLNAMAAMAAASLAGVTPHQTKASWKNFQLLTGRMEEIKNDRGIKIFIDFAVTPNAMKQVLTTCRKVTKGKLIVMFGLSAERDELKRPVMGELAASLADVVILTDDDPRFEDRMAIMNEIAAGMPAGVNGNDKKVMKIPGRDKAIAKALKLARPGDVVALLGKGHEQSMSYLGIEHPWSDQQVVKGLLTSGQSPLSYD
jgi:UDP-N-acetylmuramoyl-L-alanyl-D-glutamate--2,6-diaminopimelate ligase